MTDPQVSGLGSQHEAQVKPFNRVAIIGTGALGGSVAAALRSRGLADRICGLDPFNAAAAEQLGLIDDIADSLTDAVQGSDLVVLAAPIAVNCALVSDPQLRKSLGAQACLTDVSSTKSSMVSAVRDSLGERQSRFVASHPIAGFDRAGPSASRADLFLGKSLLMCPTPQCDTDVIERIAGMWTALGAQVASMTPQHHDALFAEVSHWPHAVAFALSAAIGEGVRADDARRFHGAGLRDTTRVGGSPADLWAGILIDNRDAVLDAAHAFRAELDRIERAIEAGDRDALEAALARGERWRSSF